MLPPVPVSPPLCSVPASENDENSPPHAVAPTLAAAKAMSAARLSRVVGSVRSGAPETCAVTMTPQNGQWDSVRRMWRSQSAHVTKLVIESGLS
jgi:hypothetical protein